MIRYKSWTLTDVVNDVWLDNFSVGDDLLRLPTPHDSSDRKRTLPGGLRHGLAGIGHGLESFLFGPHLHLTTSYTTVPGSARLVVHDVVENRSSQPAELQMLYHCNVGAPFLEAGSRVVAPVAELSPLTT